MITFHYQKELEDISRRASGAARDLMAQCRTSAEVETLLSQDHSDAGEADGIDVQTGGPHPRLRLALEYRQIEARTHALNN